MSKRPVEEIFADDFVHPASAKHLKPEHIKKHTLDSDEEDSGDDERYNILNENDIEGEEDGISGMDGEVKLTPFNMKEELEEGHFDADGHFQWDKNNDVKDNWLDNLDWIKIKAKKDEDAKNDESSDSETENEFDLIGAYRRILDLMLPKETIKRTLQRLGGKSAKMSSAERWKLKKAGIVDPNAALVTELTELTNNILTKMGNMDIYEETYELIKYKYAVKTKNNESASKTAATDDALDMYADDFDIKEKSKLNEEINDENNSVGTSDMPTDVPSEIMWEFKWKHAEDNIHGPFSTNQMQQWVEEGYFKDGVFVRKVGEQTQFHTSNRIDFELYL